MRAMYARVQNFARLANWPVRAQSIKKARITCCCSFINVSSVSRVRNSRNLHTVEDTHERERFLLFAVHFDSQPLVKSLEVDLSFHNSHEYSDFFLVRALIPQEDL